MPAFDPSKFTTPEPKPLPIVLLLDVSSSMKSKGKIDHLNQAVKTMIESFAGEEMMETLVHLSVITFGREVKLHLPYTKASAVHWTDLEANGTTPLNIALKMAKEMIEDKDTTPSRAYRPTIVLVSDGHPTDAGGRLSDNWEGPMSEFVKSGRSSKCDRMAMAIGQDADREVLSKFIDGTVNDLFFAKDAAQLHEFFQLVTMSVTMRSKSTNPNVLPKPSEFEVNEAAVKEAVASVKTDDDDDDEGFW